MRGGAWYQSRGVENAIKPPPTCRAPNMSGMQLIRLGKQNRFKFFVMRAKSLSLYLFFKSAICTSYSCWVLTFAIFPRPCSGMDLFRGLRNIPPASSFNEAPLCWFCLLKTWGKAPTPPSDCSIKKSVKVKCLKSHTRPFNPPMIESEMWDGFRFPPCNAPRRIFAPGLSDGGILLTAPWKHQNVFARLSQISKT